MMYYYFNKYKTLVTGINLPHCYPKSICRGTGAFSLVELSIVLVILGLLTGGILTGQSLIRAAELRSVVTEFKQYQTAVMTFRDKYFALPGDMRNATDFWQTMTGCGTTSASGVGTETCNGDGSGYIEAPNDGGSNNAGPDGNAEKYTFWQHLANAGLIEGSYSGVAGPSSCDVNGWCRIVGENVPVMRLSDATLDVNGYFRVFDASHSYDYSELHTVNRFVISRSAVFGGANSGVFMPEEVWRIDKKLDDGMPAKGRLRSSVFSQNAGLCTQAANSTDYDALYDLTVTAKTCTLIYIFGR